MVARKPTVLCDVDGVLANFVYPILVHLGYKHDRVHTPEEIAHFSVKMSLDLDDDTWRDCTELVCSPGFCQTLPVYSGAHEFIAQLDEIADVHFVTSPWWSSPHWMHERYTWLCQQFGQTLARKTIFTSEKHLVAGDFLIEDKPDTLLKWETEGDPVSWHGARYGILVDHPYNRDLNTQRRAHCLDDVITLINTELGQPGIAAGYGA